MVTRIIRQPITISYQQFRLNILKHSPVFVSGHRYTLTIRLLHYKINSLSADLGKSGN